MGSCHQTEKIQKNSQSQPVPQPQNSTGLREKLHQTNNNELNAPEPEIPKILYKDMPEYPGNIYKGYGIKKMKAYKCTLNIKDLNQLREDFWVKAEIYLSNNNFRTLSGCINICVDEFNNVFHVPNFCINDPYFEKEILPIDSTNTYNSQIEITIRDLYLSKNNKMKVPLGISGLELKQLYAKTIDYNLDVNKSKLIFGGCIFKNEEFLYQHGIKDGFTLQIMTIKEESI